ncbi:hypothetical protein [Coriobacterium glomerans]|nr:hypothetical protein [Coriobacterium glomerans]
MAYEDLCSFPRDISVHAHVELPTKPRGLLAVDRRCVAFFDRSGGIAI